MKDNSGIPRISNKIDEVVIFIEQLPETTVNVNWILHLLEDIRDANEEIRDCGNIQYSVAYTLNEEIKTLEIENSSLRQTILDLEEELIESKRGRFDILTLN